MIFYLLQLLLGSAVLLFILLCVIVAVIESKHKHEIITSIIMITLFCFMYIMLWSIFR